MRKGERPGGPSWKERAQSKAAAAGQSVKEDLDRQVGRELTSFILVHVLGFLRRPSTLPQVGRDLAAQLAGVAPARESEMVELARLLAEKLYNISPDPNAQARNGLHALILHDEP